MLSMYPACFFKETDGSYSVLFPDFDGTGTCGNTFAEAMNMAVDFLAGQLYDLKLEKKDYPLPSDISCINPDELYDDYESVIVNMVTVDVESYASKNFDRAVKKTLTIPAWLNERAVEQNVNFSQVLQKALKKELGIE